MSPIAAGVGSDLSLVAEVFTAGLAQYWAVPTDVTLLVGGYFWGSGGNSGAGGAALGGGGGGGAGMSYLSGTVFTPGEIYTVDVDAAGGASVTDFTSPAGMTLAFANSGTNGVLNAKGLGGAAGLGSQAAGGGDGFAGTTLAGVGGGGGGAGGSFANGASSSGQAGGAGGGSTTQLTYGLGGNGGTGGAIAAIGGAGASPGGGGGGPGKTGATIGHGSDGLAVLIYQTVLAGQAISFSHRSDVQPGLGMLNYLPGQTFPTTITDHEIGDAITLPWFVVSGVPNVVIQIVEYSYEEIPYE